MPSEVLLRSGDANAPSRLSSFGFSGTIAHALFVSVGARSSTHFASGSSLYRRGKAFALVTPSRRLFVPSLHAKVHESRVVLPTGTLAVLSHHAIGRSITIAGVEYVGPAFVMDAGRRTVFSGVPQPSSLPKALWTAKSQ